MMFVGVRAPCVLRLSRQDRREREREREFDFAELFYMLLWSRHLAAIRSTILKAKDVNLKGGPRKIRGL